MRLFRKFLFADYRLRGDLDDLYAIVQEFRGQMFNTGFDFAQRF